MDAEQVRERLSTLTSDLGKLGVGSLSLFGSAAISEATDQSDLDFLVQFEGAATFDRYMGLKELLEAAFEARIDLVTVRGLKPLLRDRILSEAVKVA